MNVEDDGERIDFSALAELGNDAEERVVSTVMRHIEEQAAAGSRFDIGTVAVFWRPALAAAAIITIVAIGTLAQVKRTASASQPKTPESRVLDWARTGHVPTNGELLATLQGYAR